MGNQTYYINEQVISIDGKLEDNLECIGSKQHKYLGQIQLWRRDSKSNPTIFSKLSHSGQRHDINVNEHNDRKKVNHPNILQYYGCQSNYLTFKGNVQQTKFFFEYIPNTLDNVINFHKKNCSYLEESEIWKIIQQIVSACSFLEKLDLFHGDLNPQTIFIDNEKQIKILYHNAYPEIITSYVKLLAYQDQNVFISPQQLNDLIKQSVIPQDNNQKTDSFQFGLTLLQLMTMTQILDDCIDYNRKTIYFKSIMDILSSARKRYSQQLINLVQRLITFDEQTRPTLSDILYDTNLQQQQQGSTFIPQSKIRRYTSPPRQPELTYSPPPDMGLSSKSPVLRDQSIQSHFRTPLQRSLSPVLDRSGKYLSPAQRRNTIALSAFKTPNKQTIIISTHTPIKNDRGRQLNILTENSRNVLMISRSPILNQFRKTSFQVPSSNHHPTLKLVTPQQYSHHLPPYQQAFYKDKFNQKQNQQDFSQTHQHFFQPYFNNQENQTSTLPKPDSAYFTKPQDPLSQQQQQSLPQQQKQQISSQDSFNQTANPLCKTPQKVPQKGINLLSPLICNNK